MCIVSMAIVAVAISVDMTSTTKPEKLQNPNP